MSVTFAPVTCSTDPWAVTCSCADARLDREFGTYEGAVATAETSAPRCGDEYCAAFPASVVCGIDVPSVNVSNRNAAHLLELLGLEPGDLTGSSDAESLLGRALVAMGLNPSDPGVPSVQDGNLIDSGRVEGYADMRLEQLVELAEWARAQQRPISWG